MDEDDSDDSVTQHEENPGVDDGFFVGTRADPDEVNDKFNPNVNHNNNVPHENPPPFPFGTGFNPNVVGDSVVFFFSLYVKFLNKIGTEEIDSW